MPKDKRPDLSTVALWLVIVGAVLYTSFALFMIFEMIRHIGPIGLLILIPISLLAYILWKLIKERCTNDPYDNIEK